VIHLSRFVAVKNLVFCNCIVLCEKSCFFLYTEKLKHLWWSGTIWVPFAELSIYYRGFELFSSGRQSENKTTWLHTTPLSSIAQIFTLFCCVLHLLNMKHSRIQVVTKKLTSKSLLLNLIYLTQWYYLIFLFLFLTKFVFCYRNYKQTVL